MGRFRPRGNATQRQVYAALRATKRSYGRGNAGCLTIISMVILLIFIALK